MPPGVRNVLVPLGSVVFSFVVVAAAGAVIGGTGAVPPPSPTAAPAPSPVVKIKILYEQADGTFAPAPAAGQSMTLDITTESRPGETRVCVAQPTGPWRLGPPWTHIRWGSYCELISSPESSMVVRLVYL